MYHTETKLTAIQKQLEYWRAYGMADDPFGDVSLENHSFWSDARDDLLPEALQLACCARQPILFYGPKGVGKTNFLQALRARLEDDELLVVVKPQAAHLMSVKQLLVELALALNISTLHLEPAEIEVRINEILHEDGLGRRSLVVLVDDAEQLSIHTIACLFNLSCLPNNHINVLLFATTDEIGMLRADLSNSAVKKIAIEPFDEPTVKEYLRFRMEMAGGEGTFPFSCNDINELSKLSRGIPQRINELARQMLQTGRVSSAELTQAPAKIAILTPWQPVASAVGLLLVIAIGIIWSLKNPSQSDEQETVIVAAKHKTTVSAKVAADSVAAILQEVEVPDLRLQAAIDNKHAPQRITAGRPGNAAARKQPPSELVNTPAATPMLESLDRTAAESSLTQRDTEKMLSARPGAIQQDVRLKGSGGTVEAAVNNAEVKAQTVFSASSLQGRLAPSELNRGYTRPATNQTLTADELQLLQLPKNSYTLQLLASSSNESVRKFVKQHKGTEILVFGDKQADRSWFVAVTGNYASVEQARSGLDGLPPALRELKPWPRQFSSVQENIKH